MGEEGGEEGSHVTLWLHNEIESDLICCLNTCTRIVYYACPDYTHTSTNVYMSCILF